MGPSKIICVSFFFFNFFQFFFNFGSFYFSSLHTFFFFCQKNFVKHNQKFDRTSNSIQFFFFCYTLPFYFTA